MPVDVSVIIPTFRRPQPLKEAIQSALAQSGVRVELLVFDDSPEGSAASVIENIDDPRVCYFRMDPTSGGKPALVRNTAWPLATGRYVHFLDDDDLVEPETYRAMVETLEKNPGVGVVFGRIEPFGIDAEELRRQQSYFHNAATRARLSHRLRSRYLMVTNMLFKDTVLVNSACMIRRECLAPLGGYDPDCIIEEDVDFYIRAIRRFGCVYLDRIVLRYRTGETSLMHDRPDDEPVAIAYRHMYAKYRAEYGAFELFALKIIARTALRWI